MITFPTEWKVIQNSKLPNSQTTNQLKNCPSSVAFPRLLIVDQLDSPYFLGENPGPTGRARRPPNSEMGAVARRHFRGNGGRKWQKCIVSVSVCDENGTTYEQKKLTQLCKWEILGQSGIPLSQLAVRY